MTNNLNPKLMMKFFFLLAFLSFGTIYGQSHTRKTRSDKGGTHKHSASYNAKKASESSSSPKQSTKSSTTKRRKK